MLFRLVFVPVARIISDREVGRGAEVLYDCAHGLWDEDHLRLARRNLLDLRAQVRWNARNGSFRQAVSWKVGLVTGSIIIQRKNVHSEARDR